MEQTKDKILTILNNNVQGKNLQGFLNVHILRRLSQLRVQNDFPDLDPNFDFTIFGSECFRELTTILENWERIKNKPLESKMFNKDGEKDEFSMYNKNGWFDFPAEKINLQNYTVEEFIVKEKPTLRMNFLESILENRIESFVALRDIN